MQGEEGEDSLRAETQFDRGVIDLEGESAEQAELKGGRSWTV
jgi:hypothetical protein